jgi:diaminopimelate epimerase
MTINFTKMHGIGNDYILIDARQIEKDWSKVAVDICDRHFGVGGDGILLIRDSDVADCRMQIYNPDGSEAEACGNGIRMFSKYVVEQGVVSAPQDRLVVQTLGAVGEIELYRDNGSVSSVRASMGPARLRPSQVPVALEDGPGAVKDYPVDLGDRIVPVTCVSMGNPHAVHFTDTPVDEFPLHDVGPRMEHHPFFPARVNFEIVNIIDRNHVRARVWERGVGETLACGTGACAIGVASSLHGFADSPVNVRLPGGSLRIDWDGEGDVLLSGPAEYVFTGVWEEPSAN